MFRLATFFRRYSIAADCRLPHVNCWRCQKLLDCEQEKFFCSKCNLIQPPVKCVNYFQYLNHAIAFNVNLPSLSSHFKNLQRQLHPDRFTTRSAEEQNFSAQQSSVVNKAYGTLSNPLSRALYLLDLNGKSLTEDEGTSTDPTFLAEMMDLNEKLADFESVEDIKKMGEKTKVVLNEMEKELERAFDQEKDIEKARAIVIRMKFYTSLQQKVHSKLGLG